MEEIAEKKQKYFPVIHKNTPNTLKKVINASFLPQQKSLHQLRESLAYHKYLQQLRQSNGSQDKNKENKPPFCFREASKIIIENYISKFEKEQRDPQLKWSCQYNNQTIDSQMLQISKQVDDCISKGLPIPKIVKQICSETQSKKQDTGIQNRMEDSLKKAKSQQYYQRDSQKIQICQVWGKEGVKLELLPQTVQNSVSKIAHLCEEKFGFGNQFKKSRISINSHKSRFQQRKKSLEQLKLSRNSQIALSPNNSIRNSMTSKPSPLKNQIAFKTELLNKDLQQVLNNYDKKRHLWSKSKSMMTQIRQQAILNNQLLKFAKKNHMKSFPLQLAKKKDNVGEKKLKTVQGLSQPLPSLPTLTSTYDIMKDNYKSSFVYLASLSLQKL